MTCPLCHAARVSLYAEAHGRRYFRCTNCLLTVLDPAQRLSPEAEHAHYRTHENDLLDPGYRRFLSRVADPLIDRLPARAEGLDYGSGPGPTLSHVLEEAGHAMSIYDPFFAPDVSVRERTYDFITATEVVEHFFSPRTEFDRIDRMIRPGGWLGVMTEMLPEDRAFSTWRYARDPTHVCFYVPATLQWLSVHYGWQMEMPRQDVVLFRKPSSPRPRLGRLTSDV